MKALERAIPPPVVMLATALIMWAISILFPRMTLHVPGGAAWAVVLAVLGLLISLSGVAAFKRSQTTVDPRKQAAASALVTTGIYRYTRNPMYLGIMVALVGWAVYLGNVFSFLWAFTFASYMHRFQIQPEERYLQERFGHAFAIYKARVREWI